MSVNFGVCAQPELYLKILVRLVWRSVLVFPWMSFAPVEKIRLVFLG
jgi:hypothetical protein